MKTVAAVAAVLALASPLAAIAQPSGAQIPRAHEVTRTVVTHEQTRSGPVVTRTTTVRPIYHRPVFHRVVHHRYAPQHHPIIRKVVVSQGYGHGVVKTATTVVRR